METKNILDAFAGAGFSAEGFKKYYNVVEAIDINEDCCKSYKVNHKETRIKNRDIRDINFSKGDYEGVIGFVGTPPCQQFSDLNQKPDLEKGTNLLQEHIRMHKEIKPEFALLENVFSVPKLIKLQVEKELQKLGYKTVSRVINAWEYGSYQIRKRWFVTSHKSKHIFPEKSFIRKCSGEIINDLPSEITPRADTLAKIQDLPQGKWVAIPGQNFKVYFILDPSKPFPAVVNPTKLRYIHPNKKQYLSLDVLLKAFDISHNHFHLAGSLSSKGQQLANGFPVALAEKFAETFYACA